MARDDTATLSFLETHAPDPAATSPALALLWSRDERERVGEVTLLDPRVNPGYDPQTRAFTIGRESSRGRVCTFTRQRPGENHEAGALRSRLLSRQQLRITPVGDELELENLGRSDLRVNGQTITRGRARPGDVIALHRRALLLYTRRPQRLPSRALDPSLLNFPFGHADAYGLVGESPALWALRERVQFLARRSLHVLIIGPSGSGKELVANAIHKLSARGGASLVSRNAATIPESLVDAELFGNARGYPNPGMRERAGLIGEAHGSSLFLDELGELPQGMQAHLLRVMDLGEYQRLGETRRRVADVRLIAATNRAASELKHDLLARFPLRLQLEGLSARREDIPLIARHLLREIRRSDPDALARFDHEDSSDTPPLSSQLVERLLTCTNEHNVRGVHATLWRALSESDGRYLDLPENEASEHHHRDEEADGPALAPGASASPTDAISRAHVAQALAACGGSEERAWRALGLTSRLQLQQLLRLHQLS